MSLLINNLYFINFNESKNNIQNSIILNNILNKKEEYILDMLLINYKDNNNNIKVRVSLGMGKNRKNTKLISVNIPIRKKTKNSVSNSVIKNSL